jgi:hypothetical protein
MSNLTISPSEQILILSTVGGLPPTSLLDTLNEQQTEHWCIVKQTFSYLHKSLKAYFAGESTPLRDLPVYEQELYDSMTNFYLNLYNVIQWGWNDILDNYEQCGNKSHYGAQFPYATPGETLAAILERDAAAQYSQCKMGLHYFKPRKMYELRREFKKLSQGKLTPMQKKKHETEVKALIKCFKSLMELEVEACICACEKALKTRNDKVLTKKIKDYRASREELSTILYKRYRNSKGDAWQNGHKLETTKEGGSYRATS